jgi:hypothetical protein
MDSWSRPSKHASTPPPLYLLPGGEATPYCHSCGRVIGSRKAQTSKNSKDGVKYCSDRCRHHKPDATDRNIENMFVFLLNRGKSGVGPSDEAANPDSPRKNAKAPVCGKKAKGEPRITILCSTVEELVFGARHHPDKVFGRKKNRAKRGVPDRGEWRSVDMEDTASQAFDDYSTSQSVGNGQHDDFPFREQSEDPFTFSAGKARPAQNVSDVNFSVGGERGWAEKIEETEELKQKRLDGQKKAEEREAVRSAARRLCAFGIVTLADDQCDGERDDDKRRPKKTTLGNTADDGSEHKKNRKKCEAVLKEGTIVEASFAKGEWGIRWRE